MSPGAAMTIGPLVELGRWAWGHHEQLLGVWYGTDQHADLQWVVDGVRLDRRDDERVQDLGAWLYFAAIATEYRLRAADSPILSSLAHELMQLVYAVDADLTHAGGGA